MINRKQPIIHNRTTLEKLPSSKKHASRETLQLKFPWPTFYFLFFSLFFLFYLLLKLLFKSQLGSRAGSTGLSNLVVQQSVNNSLVNVT